MTSHTHFPSRRGVGRRPGLLTAAFLSATLALAGCADAGRDSKGSGASDGSAADAKVADELAVAVQMPATGVNPATVNTAFNGYALLAYEPLMYWSQDGLQPALAEDWELANGNTELKITLREGVTFADGDPVTAEAVKASIEYCVSKGMQPAFKGVTGVTVEGPTHLTITSESANPMLDQMMSQGYGCGMIISPKGLQAPDELTVDNPSAGGGAYVYDPAQSVAGDHYTYTANPDYYDKGKQHYKKVTLRVISNPQAALNALTTDQVDLTIGDFTTTQQAEAAGVQIAWTPFVMNGISLIDRKGEVSKPLGDVRVRQAINYAIDRKAIAESLLGKYGTPTSQPAAPGFDMHSKDAEKAYEYDPEKAKKLLAEAGYPDGFELPLLSVKFAGIDILTQAIQPQLEAVGIKINPTMTTDEKGYIGGMTGKQFPAAMIGYGSQPSFTMARGLFGPQAMPFNPFGSSDPELDALIAELAKAPSADERGKVGMQIEDWLVEQAWFAPIVFAPVLYYGNENLGGLKVSGQAPTLAVLDVYDKS